MRRVEANWRLLLEPEHRRSHLAGTRASSAFGDVVVRGEVAYETDRHPITADPADRDGVFETGDVSYVLAGFVDTSTLGF